MDMDKITSYLIKVIENKVFYKNEYEDIINTTCQKFNCNFSVAENCYKEARKWLTKRKFR